MDAEHGRSHDSDQCRRGDRRQEAKSDQKTSEELGRSSSPGVDLARPQADLLEEAGGALDAVAAEVSKELLSAMGGEPQPDDQPKSNSAISTASSLFAG